MPAAYREGGHTAPDAHVPAIDWWRGYKSSELTSLMDAAQIYNLDIAVAIAQIAQADAQVGITGAPLLPSITGTGNAEQSRSASNGSALPVPAATAAAELAADERSRNTASGSPRAT